MRAASLVVLAGPLVVLGLIPASAMYGPSPGFQAPPGHTTYAAFSILQPSNSVFRQSVHD